MLEGQEPEVEETTLFDSFDEPPEEVPGQAPLFEADEVPVAAPEAEPAEDAVGEGGLFGADQDFHAIWSEWQGMPEFSMDDLMPFYQVHVNFADFKALEEFAKLVGQPIPPTARRQQSIWFPRQLRFGPQASDKRYRDPHDEQFWRRQPRHLERK